jgi:hypothetical protein
MRDIVTNYYKNRGIFNIFGILFKSSQIPLDIVYKIPYNSRPQTLEGL